MKLEKYKNAKAELEQLLDDETDEESRDLIQRLIHRADAKIEQTEKMIDELQSYE